MAASVDGWWQNSVAGLDGLDRVAATALLDEALDRFRWSMLVHSVATLGTVQPLYSALERLIAHAGIGDLAALSGGGGAEMAIVNDLWSVSRGAAELDTVVRRHGFHGPGEGEASSRVWREDDTPLRRRVHEYRARPDEENPRLRAERARERLPGLQREVLARVPAARRPAARALLVLAARQIPLRGVGKRAYLQSIDATRGAARALGRELAGTGLIDDPEDVFYLTVGELLDGRLQDAASLVAARRATRARYQELVLPRSWQGIPEPVVVAATEGATSLSGTGVSAGIVEGRVRVVTDPSIGDFEPGDVLVAETTDPGWAAVMFVAGALVVDIGGALSHAAVVARELGLPCVVNVRSGTRELRDGDLVLVDGKAGTVEVLKRRQPT